jgi:guanosine-diphosphatase
MLKDGRGDSILKHVREYLGTYPFPLLDDSVAIMSGDEEGVLAWITVNYLLGTVNSPDRQQTVGVLDLGGGSTQIVFEPQTVMSPGKHSYDLEFNGFKYSLYQHSYDGYGLMQGRTKITAKSAQAADAPCIPKGRSRKHGDKPEMVQGTGTGFTLCEKFISDNLFDKNAKCDFKTCSFDGIYMPPIEQGAVLYAFSYFYDNFAKLFDKSKEFKVADLKEAASRVCVDPSQQPALSETGAYEFKHNDAWCMDLGFMYSLLHVGYGLRDDRPMRTAKKIDDIEIGWSLGAAIQILDRRMGDPSNRTCPQ